MIPETTTMLLRASALINLSPEMLFIGIYDSNSYTPVALVDRDKVQINPEADENHTRTFDFTLKPHQLKAIATHIRTRDNPFVQIIIANLQFVCLRTGSGCMTGMSNFNMEYDSQNSENVKETLFNLSKRHFRSTELLSGTHALQISAILKGDVLVVGLCRSGGTCSSLKLIREILDQAPEQPSEQIVLPSDGDRKISFMSKSTSLRASLRSFSSIIDHEGHSYGGMFASQDSMNKVGKGNGSVSSLLDSLETENRQRLSQDNLESDDYIVHRRASTKTAEERRRDHLKRETEFCEDWRTTAVKSIDALRMITPVSPDAQSEDKQPLIENIETGIQEMVTSDTYSDSEDAARSKWASKKKRPSRSTFV